jgi:2-polyprenyl-3-methyl-5-hydroxy-6-metoxy-1,4-benzoquinol methylase
LLAARFPDLTVVEPVGAFIDRAPARTGGRVAFEQTLAEEFRTDRRFGTIMLTHVLEHVEDPVAVLGGLAGLLTPGGSLCIVVPNAEAPSRRIAAKMGLMSHLEGLSDADRAAGHRRVYTLETLARDVEAAGLAAHHMGGIFFKPLANFQLDALMGGPLIGDAFMEACYALGAEHPCSCASVYVVAGAG